MGRIDCGVMFLFWPLIITLTQEMLCRLVETQYGRKTHTIQADFTDGHSIYPAIAEGLQGLEVGILGRV